MCPPVQRTRLIPVNLCAFNQQLVHWVTAWVGATVFLQPVTHGFGIRKPLSFLPRCNLDFPQQSCYELQSSY